MATRLEHANCMELRVAEHLAGVAEHYLAPGLGSELAVLRKIACGGVVIGNVAAVDCRILDDEGFLFQIHPVLHKHLSRQHSSSSFHSARP